MEGKRVTEHLYLNAKHMVLVKAPCFAFVGPINLSMPMGYRNFIRDGLNGDPILVKSDGTPTVLYTQQI
jgi:hypothetical protein